MGTARDQFIRRVRMFSFAGAVQGQMAIFCTKIMCWKNMVNVYITRMGLTRVIQRCHFWGSNTLPEFRNDPPDRLMKLFILFLIKPFLVSLVNLRTDDNFWMCTTRLTHRKVLKWAVFETLYNKEVCVRMRTTLRF